MVPLNVKTIVLMYYYRKPESVRALQPMHLARKAAKWLYSPPILKLHMVKEGQKSKRKEKGGRNEGRKGGRKKEKDEG